MSSEEFDQDSNGGESDLSGISTGDLQAVMPLSTSRLDAGELQKARHFLMT